jgi:peptide deformylase
MIQPLLTYPDSRIRLISADVRTFNDEVHQWITDMIDTMKAHELDALSAIFIGLQYNIIVLKIADEYFSYINSRIIKGSENSIKTEKSIYYDGLTAAVDRFEEITIIYEDVNGNPSYTTLQGDIARIFQQQLDYCFGSTFVDRVDQETRERINDYLTYGLVANAGSCPVVFVRDYFKRAARYVMGLVALSFVIPIFGSVSLHRLTYTIDTYLLISVPLLMLAYFFYAIYESRQYKQCTSCQIGNIIGTTAILSFQLLLVTLEVVFLIAP